MRAADFTIHRLDALATVLNQAVDKMVADGIPRAGTGEAMRQVMEVRRQWEPVARRLQAGIGPDEARVLLPIFDRYSEDLEVNMLNTIVHARGRAAD